MRKKNHKHNFTFDMLKPRSRRDDLPHNLTNKSLCSSWCHSYMGRHGDRLGFLCGHRRHAAAFGFNGNIFATPSLYCPCVTFWVFSPVACGRGPACPRLGLFKTLSTLILPVIFCAMIRKHDLVHMAAWGPYTCRISWIIKVSVPEWKCLPASLVLDGLYIIMGTTWARGPTPTAAVGSIEWSAIPLVLGQLLCAWRRNYCRCSV